MSTFGIIKCLVLEMKIYCEDDKYARLDLESEVGPRCLNKGGTAFIGQPIF